MNISFEGQITKEDFRIAYQISIKQRIGILRWLLMLCLVISCLMVALLILVSGRIQVENVLLLLASVLLVLLFAFLPRLAARSYNKEGNDYRFPIHGTISDEGLFLSTRNSEGTVKWTAFTGYACSGDRLLLFRGKRMFNMLTRDLFSSEEEWDQVIDFIEERIPGKPK
jgi:Ca2+/Na+ antiporter